MNIHTINKKMRKKDRFTERYDMSVQIALTTYDTVEKLMVFFNKYGYRKGFKLCRDIINYSPNIQDTERFRDLFEIVHLTYLKDFFEHCKKHDIEIEMLNRWKTNDDQRPI